MSDHDAERNEDQDQPLSRAYDPLILRCFVRVGSIGVVGPWRRHFVVAPNHF
jgi:hypothetical protein